MTFLHTEMVQVVEILSPRWQGPTYYILVNTMAADGLMINDISRNDIDLVSPEYYGSVSDGLTHCPLDVTDSEIHQHWLFVDW